MNLQFEAGRAVVADALYPCAFDQSPLAFMEFGGQAVEKRHGVELGLICQPDSAVEGEGHVGVVDPFGIQARGLTGLQLGPGFRDALGGLGVGAGVVPLQVDSAGRAVVDQPLLAFEIALDVLLGHLRRVLGRDVAHPGALQQADLGCGVAGGAGTGGACLQHQHVLSGACQQHSGDEVGDPGADHDDVRASF